MFKSPLCQGCPLYHVGESFSSPEGLGTSGVAIIGEALGYEESIDGLPFRPKAQAGSKLEEIFRLAASQSGRPISRNQFLLWNILGCRPPGNELRGSPYEKQAIEHCRIHFNSHINDRNASCHRSLLALGNTPLVSLTGVTGNPKEKQSISQLRGYLFQSSYGLIVPSYHPAFLKRGNNHLTPLVVEDLLKAIDVARGTYPSISNPFDKGYVPPVYQEYPGLDEAWSFYYKVKDNPRLVLTFDIETPETSNVDEDERDELANADLVLVQFSVSRGTGIAFPYEGQYKEIIQGLFALPNIKANHNTYNFDNPRLTAKGIKINGVVHDTMWMFKWWHSQLPRGLQNVASMFGFPFPWKHLYKANLNYYGCADVDAVQWILRALPPLMKQRGIWEGYKRHILGMHTILERGSQIVGIPVNENKRQEVIADFKGARDNLNKALQKGIPLEIRNIKPKRKDKATGQTNYGYIREPKIVSKGSEEYRNAIELLRRKFGESTNKPLSLGDFLNKKYNLYYGIVDNANGNDITKNGSNAIHPISSPPRWFIIEPFKGSSQQLIRYLKWKQDQITQSIEEKEKERQERYQGRNPLLTEEIVKLRELAKSYDIPKDLKTKRDTTGKKELEEIFYKNEDPIIEKVMEIRSLDTNLNNYLPNWKPHSDGSVHTTFGFTAPTNQLDSRRPNILNCSKHTKYGQLFRRIIEAPSGYVFIEADKKSFHVATTGYCANDPTYIKFSQTDPHSILGSYIDPSLIGCSIDLRWTESDIIAASKAFKKRSKEIREKDPVHGIDIRQQMAKPVVLGNQLGLGAIKLQRQNRRFIKTVRDAEKLQELIAGLFPKVELFKTQIKNKAFQQRYLINEFGMIQYFFDVYNFVYNKRQGVWDRRDGEGARAPIAFMVQGNAFGMIQCETLEMERKGYCERFNWNNSIHDSNMFMPRIEDKDRCIEAIYEEMNKPCQWLVNDATEKIGGEKGKGLVVKVEISIGKNWMAWDKDKNPEGMREI